MIKVNNFFNGSEYINTNNIQLIKKTEISYGVNTETFERFKIHELIDPRKDNRIKSTKMVTQIVMTGFDEEYYTEEPIEDLIKRINEA